MYFENGFIKNENILLETSNCDDLLDWESDITKFSNRIDELKGSLIWGIVGQFGVGKSTLINNVKNRRNDEKHDEKRFEFDAWKYPDRKDLREGFVLDFAKQVDEKEFNKARKRIDGNQNDDKKVLLKLISQIIPGGNALSELAYFFRTSPAKRVFEIQEIFQELVKKIDENRIIIVIEDIDRSGDAGIFFLETLKQFITKNDFGKEILVIMPLGTDEYYNNLDSYLKPIDYFDFFNPGIPTLDLFIKQAFNDEIINNIRYFQPLKEFLEGLFIYYPENINLRKLKLILRKANQNHIMMFGKYDENFELDWRINIIFETMKYIGFDDSKNSMFEQLRKKKETSTINTNSIIGAYINNLVGLTKRGFGQRYFGEGNSLYTERIDDERKKRKELITQKNLSIKFYEGTTFKEILGCLYIVKDFDKKPDAIVLPYAYFEY